MFRLLLAQLPGPLAHQQAGNQTRLSDDNLAERPPTFLSPVMGRPMELTLSEDKVI